MIKWARSQGYEWDSQVYIRAALYDQFHIVEWARDNGCPIDWKMIEADLSAIDYQKLESMLK